MCKLSHADLMHISEIYYWYKAWTRVHNHISLMFLWNPGKSSLIKITKEELQDMKDCGYVAGELV